MKKYYPVDFDEKGNAVLGNAKSNPTSNGFIPTAWAPGGSDEGKQGLKSITISPALDTTPALDSLFPFYWDEAQAKEGWQRFEQVLTTGVSLTERTKYTVTVTPTSEWLAGHESQYSEAGQPFTYETTVTGGILKINPWISAEDDSKGINVLLTVIGGK